MKFLWSFCLFFTLLFATFSPAADTIKVLSDRTESHLKPLFEQFEKTTGIKISAVFVEKGLVNRLESKPDEADLVITKDGDLLEIAMQKRLLQPFSSKKIVSEIPGQFLEKKHHYFVDAYRARVIIYSKARVKPDQLSTYEDLASVKWKGKFCVRSGYHDYNLSLFGQMISFFGPAKAKEIISGFHANLAFDPIGNDREQAKAIMEGKCDVALLNTYYYPIMLTTPEQKTWAEATRVFFPNQAEKGTFVLSSALGLTKAKGNLKNAEKLLEFFASQEGQTMTANLTFQYPANKSVKPHELLAALGGEQKEVKDGKFKINFIPLAEIAKHREEVIKLLNEINFDKK